MNNQRFKAIVVSYSPGPFEYNKDLREKIKLESLKFSVSSRLRYSEDSDFVGLQIDVIVEHKEGRLLNFGFVASRTFDNNSGLIMPPIEPGKIADDIILLKIKKRS
ncbi:MAG: hypothetical protein K2N05_05960 [Muribaculaceae bacterium]|nr:hypothetical protein [Muribaculaceae bacterium]